MSRSAQLRFERNFQVFELPPVRPPRLVARIRTPAGLRRLSFPNGYQRL
jgi:hypothetical protein